MLNTVVLLAPGAMLPVSQAPELLVDVCATPSWLVHVIVVPTAIVSNAGLNAKLFMRIVLAGVCLGVEEDEFAPYGFEESLQPLELINPTPTVNNKINANSDFMFVSFI